jgi:hypothetical protein
MSDDQQQEANKKARELAGSAVDAGCIPFPEGKTADGEPKKHAPFVRLTCEGYPDSRFQLEVGAILNKNGVFRRDRLAVVINRESSAVEPMTPNRFRTYCEKHMIPAKFHWNAKANGGQGDWDKVPKTMNKETAAACLESDWFIDQQRPIRRVNFVRMPILRKDGRIELLPYGYDAESRIFTVASDIKIDENMPLDTPKDGTKRGARDIINDLVREFPFGDYKEDTAANREAGVVGLSRSKAVHVANMVSLFAAGLLHELVYRLHFCYVANAQRSGKTLLAKTAIVPIFGPAKATPKPESEDDLRKRLTTAAQVAAPYLFLDDLDGLLRSQSLNAFMTAPTWTDRKMGSHDELVATKETVVIITGNNLSLSTDIANRTLRCNLYTEEFDAQTRTIERVIDEEYLARPGVRGEILSALWAFIREWDRAGRPKGKRVLRGFEQWCEVFGGVVINAGFGDPIEPPPSDDFSGDQEAADMMTLVQALVADMERLRNVEDLADGKKPESLKKKEFTFEELVEAAQANDCFSWMMSGTTKKDDEGDEYIVLDQRSKSALGKLFAAKYGGRKFRLKDGRVVQFGKRGRNRHRKYSVEIVDTKA